MDAKRVLFALARHFGPFQQKMIPEFDLEGNREDLVVVSKAGYATVIEIKVSRGDWMKPKEKQRWARPSKYITRFFYAVPRELYAAGVPAHVPQFAGILTVKPDSNGGFDWVRQERPAERLKAEKLPAERARNIDEAFYYRFWRLHMGLEQTRLFERLA